MPFSLYVILSEHYMTLESPLPFAHVFHTICWNLMCRSVSAVEICLSHLEWHDDSLAIYFTHTKGDQTGDRPADPRHVYANPLQSAICPILALGIYMIVSPETLKGTKLFPGGSQYDRFRKKMLRELDHPTIKQYLANAGVDATNIRVHSTRKGSASFVAGGSTSCPSHTSICIRVGWSLGGVESRDLRYEAAGDQFVGRTVSGLPIDRPEFAILPPFFLNVPEDLLSSAISSCFPFISDEHLNNLRGVAKYCLASLVYHREFLKAKLPASHPLFHTPLYTSDYIGRLAEFAHCRVGKPEDPIRATGVLAHVAQIVHLDNTRQAVEQVAPTVIKGVIGELEKRSVEVDRVSYTGLQEALAQQMNEMKELIISSQATAATQREETSVETPRLDYPLFYWGGRYRRVPEGFSIPSVSLPIAWMLWCVGDQSQNIPPFQCLDYRDFDTRSQKGRLSEYQFAMRALENEAKRKGCWKAAFQSDQEVMEVFNQVSACMYVPLTGRKRKERADRTWKTMVNIYRKRLKIARDQQAEVGSDQQ